MDKLTFVIWTLGFMLTLSICSLLDTKGKILRSEAFSTKKERENGAFVGLILYMIVSAIILIK